MKKILLSLCLCLALTSPPCSLHAEGPSWTKPSRMITTGILGATLGGLLGAGVAAFTSTSTPIAIGAGAGLVLGVVYAAMTPTSEAEEAGGVAQAYGEPAQLQPPGIQAAPAEAGAFR
jgi:hypothetical protein